MTVMSSHKNLYGEFNTRHYALIQGFFASLRLFLMVGKGLIKHAIQLVGKG